MPYIVITLLSTAVIGIFLKRRASRKDALDGTEKGSRKNGSAFAERHEARRKIVQEAARLRDLEDAILRFGEGSDPIVSVEESERLRREAARLRSKLESECLQRGLPIALVRRGRAGSVLQMARTPGRD